MLGGTRGIVLASRYLIEPCGSGKSRIMHLSRVDTKYVIVLFVSLSFIFNFFLLTFIFLSFAEDALQNGITKATVTLLPFTSVKFAIPSSTRRTVPRVKSERKQPCNDHRCTVLTRLWRNRMIKIRSTGSWRMCDRFNLPLTRNKSNIDGRIVYTSSITLPRI